MTDPSTQDPTIETDTNQGDAHGEADTNGDTDANQGEGNVVAAMAYDDAATAFASEPARVAEAAQAAVAAEPGPFVAFASTDAGEVDAAIDADLAVAIEVTFDGAGWRIHDPASPDEPVFLKLQDAEQRAATLARASGRGVCIRDQGGDVVAKYAAAPPQ